MKTLLIPIAFVATAASVPAFARQEADIRSTTVSYGDLDLRSAAGQAALERRLQYAINNVCSDTDRRSLDAKVQSEACRNEAKARLTATVERLASAMDRPGGPGAKAAAAPINAIAP